MNLLRQRLSILTILIITFILFAGCNADSTFTETFDEQGTWGAGNDSSVEGGVTNGVYRMLVKANTDFRWSTTARNFRDGTYQVEATHVSGPLNNGYGMLLRVDEEANNFYLFEISSDGFVWIGRYRGEEQEQPLVGEWWFESSAIKTGLNQTNVLRVEAEGQNLIFLVNDQEVGRVTDDSYSGGDIGIMVETLGEGGVEVHFDNFTVIPPEN